MIPFKILAAALSTLIIIIGKISEEVGYQKEFHGSPYWKVVLSTISGISAYLWVSSIFGMASHPPIGIFFGISACIACIAYGINKIDFPVSKATDKMSVEPEILNKRGTITLVVNNKPQKDGDIACVGELFEDKQTVLVHLCEDVKIGDTFCITQVQGDKIYGVINNYE